MLFKISIPKLILTISFAGIWLTFPLLTQPALAASDFTVTVDRIFRANIDGETLHVTERRTFTSNSTTYYIPAGAQEEFTIHTFKSENPDAEMSHKLDTLKVTDQHGRSLTHTTAIQDKNIKVSVGYPSDIRFGQTQVIQIEYDTDELQERIGKVTNIFVPGLTGNLEEQMTDPVTRTTTQITYRTTLEVPKSLGEPSSTQPPPSSTTSTADQYVYEFDTLSILERQVWHQIGSEQIYYFKLTQYTTRTDFSTPGMWDFLSKDEYRIVLPREYDETQQKVYFSNLSPAPEKLEKDDDGNLIATFYIDANADKTITVEGYITVSTENKATTHGNGAQLSDIGKYSEMQNYLKESEYWEVNSPEIQQKARELAGGETEILTILRANYEFIIDSIDYSEFKYGNQNTRQGALATLRGGESVCMEYSDLLIALTRAQGIPSRAAYGYGYDPKLPMDQQENHQWVQVWVPDYGWLSIDPTWGETGREYIGADLDHALWYVASQHPNVPPPLEVVSAGRDYSLEPIQMEIIAITEIPSTVTVKSASELLQETGTQTKLDQVTRFVQTSMLGRSLLVIVPAIGGILALALIFSLLSRILRKK